MSKDEFPRTMTPNDVLEKMYSFMEEWKARLYDMISFNTTQSTNPVNVPTQVTFDITLVYYSYRTKLMNI